MMITNDYLKGYISSLNHVKETIDSFIQNEKQLFHEGTIDHDDFLSRKHAFEQVSKYLVTIKENYKNLVQTLNKQDQ